MKRVFCYALAVLGISLAVATVAQAQVAYNEGTVNRVVLISRHEKEHYPHLGV
jgi:hypothetical protein